jgi:hypothetical protein
MTWKLRFQLFLIFLEMAPRMVKGGPDWWPQIKACWQAARHEQAHRLYGKFAPYFERFKAAARAFAQAGITMKDAFEGVKASFAKMVPVLKDAWAEIQALDKMGQ